MTFTFGSPSQQYSFVLDEGDEPPRGMPGREASTTQQRHDPRQAKALDPQRTSPMSPQSQYPASQYNNYHAGSQIQVTNPQINSMSPAMVSTMGQLMKQVEKETAWSDDEETKPSKPRRKPQKTEEKSSSSESDTPPTRKRGPDMLGDRMARLNINDQSQPAFSRVKSDPQVPLATNAQAIPHPEVSMHAVSTLDIPTQIKDRLSTPAQSQSQPLPNPFLPGAWPNPWGVPPDNGANAPSVRVDQSVHSTTSKSWNADNQNIYGSHNNNSIKASVVQEPGA